MFSWYFLPADQLSDDDIRGKALHERTLPPREREGLSGDDPVAVLAFRASELTNGSRNREYLEIRSRRRPAVNFRFARI